VLDFPDYGALLAARRAGAARIPRTPQAVTEVRYVDLDDAANTCALFRRVADAEPGRFTERFMTAASPGIIATTLLDARTARTCATSWRWPERCGRSTS